VDGLLQCPHQTHGYASSLVSIQSRHFLVAAREHPVMRPVAAGWSKEDLVATANSWVLDVAGLPHVPELQQKTVSMMQLKGVAGIRVAGKGQQGGGRPQQGGSSARGSAQGGGSARGSARGGGRGGGRGGPARGRGGDRYS
jgi:hypothetical protein